MTQNTDKITIETSEGVATIDAALFKGYRDELFNYYTEQDNIKTCIKEVVETVAETTGLPKSTVNKFFKAAYEAKIAEQAKTAELFGMLQEILA